MRMRKTAWAQDFLKEQEVVVPDASALAGAWKQTLKRAELHVEIGTGKGDYWVQMAQKYPDIAWVGVEKHQCGCPGCTQVYPAGTAAGQHAVYSGRC